MTLSKLFESGTQKRSTLHFANIVKLAMVDGEINGKEQQLLDTFAKKLGINEDKVYRIYEHLDTYPIPSVTSKEMRLEYLYEVFKMIYADHEIDEPEMKFLQKYALGLGFSKVQAETYINSSIKLFSGNFTFEEYQMFIGSLVNL